MNEDKRIIGYITNIKENEIFVFGSNLSGIHGKGAAKQALKWGAIYGNPEGIQGNTYAIPTKGQKLEILPLDEISIYIKNFLDYVINNPDKIFLVSDIGCGLAKYKPSEITPLFKDFKYIKNVYFSKDFWKHI